MAILDKFKKKKIQGVDDTEYLTLRDERRISKENAKITREFERNKARKNVPESEYLSEMRDPKNVVEFDDRTMCRRAQRSASWANPAAASPLPRFR